MKFIWIILVLTFISCKKEKPSNVSTPEYNFDSKDNSQRAQKPEEKYNFDEKEEESCDTEEELEKKVTKPKQEAFKLQGGDPGCEVK